MKEYIPKTKDDLVAVKILEQTLFENVQMDVSILLEYLQDLHWDVARRIGVYLAPHVNLIKSDLLEILLSNDEEWKFGVLSGLIALSPVTLDEDLVSILRRIKEQPTEKETYEELNLVAGEILNKDII